MILFTSYHIIYKIGDIFSLNRNLTPVAVGIGRTYTTQCTIPYDNCYYVPGSGLVTIQFLVRSDVILPTGTQLFQMTTTVARPTAVRKLPAIMKNNGQYFAWYVDINEYGYIVQNGGNSVTEIWVDGSYII